MKLVFTKLETPSNEIKVAFDGVNYKSYNVDEIKTNGYIQFTEEECPDLTKVKIQGKFSTLGSVEVNKAIELERGEGGESYPAELRIQCGQLILFSDFLVERKSSNPLKFNSRDSRYSLTELRLALESDFNV